MKIKHIVVPTDLSETSAVAHPHVEAFAKIFGARVSLIHVDDQGGVNSLKWVHPNGAQFRMDAMQRRAEALEQERATLAARGIEVSARMLGGDPAKELLSFAEDEAAELIVMPKHGRGFFERMLLGSVSSKVMRRARVPVLLLDIHAPVPETVEYRRLISATDFSADSHRGLLTALEVGEAFDAEVIALHIIEPPNTLVLMPGEAAVTWPSDPLAYLEEHYQARLKTLCDELGAGRLSQQLVIDGRVARALTERAEETDADLIVIPTHGKGALLGALVGSTSTRVVQLSERPILVIPPI